MRLFARDIWQNFIQIVLLLLFWRDDEQLIEKPLYKQDWQSALRCRNAGFRKFVPSVINFKKTLCIQVKQNRIRSWPLFV